MAVTGRFIFVHIHLGASAKADETRPEGLFIPRVAKQQSQIQFTWMLLRLSYDAMIISILSGLVWTLILILIYRQWRERSRNETSAEGR